MPNGQNIEDDELQLEVEDTSETESDEDTQNTGNDGEGESEEELNLDNNSDEKVEKLSPAEENAKRQLEAWYAKVVSGKAKVEDAPKWLQKGLNSRLESIGSEVDIDQKIEATLAKKEEEQEFKKLKSAIPRLTKAQANELNQRFAKLKPIGKVEALRTALDLMGLSEKMREAERRGIAKGRTSIPVSGQPSVKKSSQLVGGVPLDVIRDDKKWNQAIRDGN